MRRLAILLAFIASPASAEWYAAQRSDAVLVYTAAERDTATLAIECRKGQLVVYVHWRRPMAGVYAQAVAYRLDEANWVTATWRLSAQQDTTGVWNQAARPLLRQLLGRSQLTVRATTQRNARVEASFQVTGLERAFRRAKVPCSLQ